MNYLNSHQTRNDMDRLSAETCPVYTEALDRWTNEGGALGANDRAHRHAGAATSVPAFAQLDVRARAELVEFVRRETEAVAQRFRVGDTLVFPMFTHIAVGHT